MSEDRGQEAEERSWEVEKMRRSEDPSSLSELRRGTQRTDF